MANTEHWRGFLQNCQKRVVTSSTFDQQKTQTDNEIKLRPVNNWRVYLKNCHQLLGNTNSFSQSGTLTRVAGLVMEAVGLKLAVGSSCLVSLVESYFHVAIDPQELIYYEHCA